VSLDRQKELQQRGSDVAGDQPEARNIRLLVKAENFNAPVEQLLDRPGANTSGRTGNENAHQSTVSHTLLGAALNGDDDSVTLRGGRERTHLRNILTRA